MARVFPPTPLAESKLACSCQRTLLLDEGGNLGGLSSRQNALIQLSVTRRHVLERISLLYMLAHHGGSNRLANLARPRGHFLHRLADEAVRSVFNNFSHRPPRKSQHRGAARHGFEHHQAEGLVPLNRKQHGSGITQEFILSRQVSLAYVFDETAVQMRFDFGLKVIAEHGLDFTSNFQGQAGFFGCLNGKVRSLDGRDPAQESQVVLLFLAVLISGKVQAMVDGLQVRHALLPALEVADGDVIDLGEVAVEITQFRYVGMMNGVNERAVDITGADEAGSIIDMNKVAGTSRILHRPGGVIQVLEVVINLAFDRPLCLREKPAGFSPGAGFPIGVNDDIQASLL